LSDMPVGEITATVDKGWFSTAWDFLTGWLSPNTAELKDGDTYHTKIYNGELTETFAYDEEQGVVEQVNEFKGRGLEYESDSMFFQVACNDNSPDDKSDVMWAIKI